MRKNNSPKKGCFLKKSKKLKKTRILIEKLGKLIILGVRGGFWAFLTRKDRRHIGKWEKWGSEPKKWLFWGPNFRYDRRHMGAILGLRAGFGPFWTPNDRRHIGKPQINSDYVHRFAYYLVKIINFPISRLKFVFFSTFWIFLKNA